MDKRTKLTKLIGAVIAFNVDTPESASGEKTQLVILKIERVYRAKVNLQHYVAGIALKRLETPTKPEYRQYKVSRIHNHTIAIIADNAWSKTMPKLRRCPPNAVSAE